MKSAREEPNSIATSPMANGGLRLRRVAFDRPWEWLAAGWRDMWQAPLVSLVYGVIATALGLSLTLGLGVFGWEAVVPVLAGGFLIVAPLLAVGLYEKSKLLQADRKPTLRETFLAARRTAWRFGLLAALLLFLYMVWLRIAFMLLALFLGTRGLPPAREFLPELLFTTHGLGLLVTGTAVGAVFAAVAFAATAIAIPLLMDREVDAFTAITKSFEAVFLNLRPMLLWAALIASFVAVGVATLGAGLIVAFPLLGHATWHAYQDLVEG